MLLCYRPEQGYVTCQITFHCFILLSDGAARCESPFVLLWKLRERTNRRSRVSVITYATALNARTVRSSADIRLICVMHCIRNTTCGSWQMTDQCGRKRGTYDMDRNHPDASGLAFSCSRCTGMDASGLHRRVSFDPGISS